STAELAITLILALSRRVLPGHEMAVKNEFNGWQVMGYLGGNQVVDKTLAIVGFGQIGQFIGKLAQAFNMKLLYVDLEEKDTDLNAKKASPKRPSKEENKVLVKLTNKKRLNTFLVKKNSNR